VGNDFDSFFPIGIHEKIDFEGDAIRPFADPGRDHRQCQEIMESASGALPLGFQTWWHESDITIIEMIGDSDRNPEPECLGVVSDIDEDTVSECLCAGVAVDDVPVVIRGHGCHLLSFALK